MSAVRKVTLRSLVLVGAVAAALVAATPASAASVAACTNKQPVLRFNVDRNSTGKDRTRRAISLSYGGYTSAAAITPIRLTIVRGGKTVTKTWPTLNGEYRYKAHKGESVAFMAIYAEDSSGYGRSTTGTPTILPIPLPVDVAGLGSSITPPLQAVFGLLPSPLQPLLQVLVPTGSNPGAFASNICARIQPLVVSEKAAATKSRHARKAASKVRHSRKSASKASHART